MTDTCYLEIVDVARPFPIAVDAGESRTMYSINFTATSDGAVQEWEEDLIRLCQSAVPPIPLVLNTDTLIGRRKPWPSGDGPFHRFIDTSGLGAELSHNGDVQENLGAQVVVIGRDEDVARTRALAIWRALKIVRNTTVTSP